MALWFLALVITALLMSHTVAAAQTVAARPATVTMRDGTAYEVSGLIFRERTGSGTFYRVSPSYSVDYIPLFYRDAVLLKIPTTHVQAIEIKATLHERSREATVLLLDGVKLSGVLEDRKDAYRHKVESVTGRGNVEGYPAAVDISIFKVAAITFTKNQEGKVLAAIRETQGQTREGIEQIRFRVDGEDDRSATISLNRIRLRIGDATLEVPTTDVVSIVFEGDTDRAVLNLIGGKTLEGTLTFLVTGDTIEQGWKASFIAGARRVRSIEFK